MPPSPPVTDGSSADQAGLIQQRALEKHMKSESGIHKEKGFKRLGHILNYVL